MVTIGSVLAIITGFGGAAATVDAWAPWAKIELVQQMAADLYPASVTQVQQQIIYNKDRLEIKLAQMPYVTDPAKLSELQDDVSDLKLQIESLERYKEQLLENEKKIQAK